MQIEEKPQVPDSHENRVYDLRGIKVSDPDGVMAQSYANITNLKMQNENPRQPMSD